MPAPNRGSRLDSTSSIDNFEFSNTGNLAQRGAQETAGHQRQVAAPSKPPREQPPGPTHHGPAIRASKQATATTEDYQDAISTIKDLTLENKKVKIDNESLISELANVRREFEEYKARLIQLVAPGSEVLHPKADSLPISEVIDKVGVLNEEIFQAAASFAETVVHSKRNFFEEDMQRYCDRASKLISEPMVNLLLNLAQQPVPEINPLIVHAVLSIFMVGFSVSKLESWYPSDRDLSAFLGTLYNEIRTSEEQAVSGRWRALTRSRTRPTTDDWKAEVIECLQCVLIVAAWDSTKDHRTAFEQKLVPIFKVIEDLRIALGEKFTSADLEVNAVRAGSKFEPWMEDAYGDGRQSGGKRDSFDIVHGTTGIGLKKIVIRKGYQGPERFEPILPPKVVLESTLRDALDPPSAPIKNEKKKAQSHLDGKGDSAPICHAYGKDL